MIIRVGLELVAALALAVSPQGKVATPPAAAPVAAQPAAPSAAPPVAQSVAPSAAPSAAPASPPVAAVPADSADSWARPDVPISRQPPWGYVTDPRKAPSFAADGELTELIRGRTRSITPYVFGDFYGRWVVERVCEPLGRIDPVTLEMRGVLADAWQLDPERRWLRVHINPKARFSDGRPVTAEDVRWTVQEVVLNPRVDAMRWRASLEQITDVKVIDDHTVEFTYSEPIFNNLEYSLSLFVLPKHFYSQFTPEQLNTSTGLLMGSGMFRMPELDPRKQWTSSEDIVLVRNDQYWGRDGDSPPALKSIRFRAVPDDLARLTALRRGEGEITEPTSMQLVKVPAEDPTFLESFKVLKWINLRSPYSFIAWQTGPRNGRKLPFADKRVRQAMTMLLDREKILRDIWAGVGQVATGPANPNSKVHNPAIKPWPFDPERAAELLAEAGWEDRDGSGILRNAAGEPFEFELTIMAGSEVDERLGNYIRDQCAGAGIRCRLRPTDWAIFNSLSKARDFDAIVLAWLPSSPEPDPRQVYHSAAIGQAGDNIVQWSCPEADRLIDEGRRTIDTEKRHAIWRRFLEVLHEEQPYTFLRDVPWFRFVSRRVGNTQTYPGGLEPWEFFVGSEVIADGPGQPVQP